MNVFSALKVYFPILAILGLLLNSCSKKEDPAFFYHPADFDKVSTTLFLWSDEHQEIIPLLIGIISKKDPVGVFVGENDDTVKILKILQKFECNFLNVSFQKVSIKPDNIWIRDFSPVFVINRSGERKLVVFNYFGTKSELVEEYSRKMNLPIIHSDIISTGGAREGNGKGTIILCETHELDVNKPKTKQEIEKEIKEKLAVKKVIWLKRGIPQDDSPFNGPIFEQIYPNGINGHVDEFCRFADQRTILISYVSEREANQHPILAEAKKRLDENYDILINATDQDGKKFKIIQVPYAPLHIVDRSTKKNRVYVTPVTSYMNFIITKSMVILPSYCSEDTNQKVVRDKEKAVVKIFRRAFPSREIKMVPVGGLNYFSGGFHCISINQPEVGF